LPTASQRFVDTDQAYCDIARCVSELKLLSRESALQGNKARHIQFVTGGTIADDNPSFSNWNAFARIEGYGLKKSRPGDRVGFSGWYSGLSDDLKDLAAPAINIGDNWGLELYYNREITPWFHLTGDLQVLQNSNADTDTSLVLGMRAIFDL
jgi:porin